MTHNRQKLDDPILDMAYDVPECVFEILKTSKGESLRDRVWLSPGHDFLELDKSRWFVRGLFPVPVEGGLEFRFGIWLELPSRAEFHHLMKVWDDPVAYERLSFDGKLANTLERDDVIGSYLYASGGPDVNQKPKVHGADSGTLRRLLADGWTRDEHERVVGQFA